MVEPEAAAIPPLALPALHRSSVAVEPCPPAWLPRGTTTPPPEGEDPCAP